MGNFVCLCVCVLTCIAVGVWPSAAPAKEASCDTSDQVVFPETCVCVTPPCDLRGVSAQLIVRIVLSHTATYVVTCRAPQSCTDTVAAPTKAQRRGE